MTAKIQCIKLALDIIIKQNNNNNNRTINKVSRYVYAIKITSKLHDILWDGN